MKSTLKMVLGTSILVGTFGSFLVGIPLWLGFSLLNSLRIAGITLIVTAIISGLLGLATYLLKR